MASIQPPPDISQRTAPLLIGILIDYFLFGILTLQLYIYACSFPSDKISIKLLIYSVYLLELAQICCAGADAYYWFCSGFGNLEHLDNTYISAFDTPLLGSVVAFIVQLFYCHRIWKLRTNKWHIVTCVAIAVVSILQLASGIVGCVNGHINRHFSALPSNSSFEDVAPIGGAISDVFIAVAMTHLILGSDSERRMCTGAVDRVVRLIIQSNSLTAGTAIVGSVLFTALPGKNYFVTPAIVQGKLYSNTLLATFNQRVFLRWSEDSGPTSRSIGLESRGRAARASARGFNEVVTENKTYI